MNRRTLGITEIRPNISCGEKSYGLRTRLPESCVSILTGNCEYLRWERDGKHYKISKTAQGNGAVRVYKNGKSHRVVIPRHIAGEMGATAKDKLKWLVASDGSRWEIHVEVKK